MTELLAVTPPPQPSPAQGAGEGVFRPLSRALRGGGLGRG
jgi:hypothetical protein